jgi:hypothetical protein
MSLTCVRGLRSLSRYSCSVEVSAESSGPLKSAEVLPFTLRNHSIGFTPLLVLPLLLLLLAFLAAVMVVPVLLVRLLLRLLLLLLLLLVRLVALLLLLLLQLLVLLLLSVLPLEAFMMLSSVLSA